MQRNDRFVNVIRPPYDLLDGGRRNKKRNKKRRKKFQRRAVTFDFFPVAEKQGRSI